MDEKLAQDMAEYIQLTEGIIANHVETIQKQATELTQKQASAGLDGDAVVVTIDNCISAGFIKEAEREQAINAVESDPATLLGFIDKLAAKSVETRKAVTPLGRAVDTQKTAKSLDGKVRESDLMFETAFSAPVHR